MMAGKRKTASRSKAGSQNKIQGLNTEMKKKKTPKKLINYNGMVWGKVFVIVEKKSESRIFLLVQKDS